MRSICNYCQSTKWAASNDKYCTDCERNWYREVYPQIMADNIMKECNSNLHLLKKATR